MAERILTLHPEGKQGVNIDLAKYTLIRQAILDSIGAQGEIAFTKLDRAVAERLPASFAGSIGWYTITVKLDLEARGEIERVPGRSPQVLRIVSQ